MGTFNQLKLTLWKNVTIRKRQPITILLEFLWPIIVFLVIASVRHMFPPESRGDCAYRARALPSAGLLPFTQSFVCNLDNQCYNLSSYEKIPSYRNAKIGPLVDQFYPLVQREDVQNVLNTLSTTMLLASHAVQSLDRPPVRKVLGERILVQDLFKNPTAVMNYLIEDAKLDGNAIRQLFLAAIDVGQLLRTLPSVGVTQMACRKDVLDSVLEFPDSKGAEAAVGALCPLVSRPIPPGLMQKLVMQVDVRRLVRRGTVLLHALGSVDVAAVLDGVGDIVDALQDIPILGSLAKAPISADTEQLADYLQHAIEFFTVLKGLDLDFDFLGEMMDDIERIVGPNEFVAHVKVVGKHIHRLISWSQHGILEGPAPPMPTVSDVLADPEDFTRRLHNGTDLTEDDISTMMSIRLKPGMSKREEVCYKLCEEMTVEDVVEFEGTVDTSTLFQLWTLMCMPGNCQKFLKEDFTPAEWRSNRQPATITVETIATDLKDLLSGAAYIGDKLGDGMKKIFPLVDMSWKAASTALSVILLPKWSLDDSRFFEGLASTLETLPAYLPEDMRLPVLNLLTATDVVVAVAIHVAKKGSEAENILYQKLFKDPKILAQMLSLGPRVASSVADVLTLPDTLEILLERPSDAYSFLCNTTLVKQLLLEGSSNEEGKVLEEFLCSLPVVDLVEAFASLENRENLIKKVETMLMANGEMDEDTAFDKRVRSLCLQIWEVIEVVRNGFKRSENWERLLMRLDVTGQNLTEAPWKMVLSKLELVRYDSILNVYTSILGQSLATKKFVGRVGKVTTQVGVMLNAVANEALTVPREFLINLGKYWPSIVRIFLEGLADPETVRVVARTRPWALVICNETAMDAVFTVPPYLDNTEFRDFFCNLTTYVETSILQVNWFNKPFVKMINGLGDGQRPIPKTKINWKVTWQRVQEVLGRYGRFAQQSLQYAAQVEELTEKTKTVFENLNVTNIFRLGVSMITTALEFLDRQLETLQPWAWKNIKALVSVLGLLVQHMNKELERILAEDKVEAGVLAFRLPTLTKMMQKVIRLFPDFMNVLADLLTSRLGDFIGRVFRIVETGATVPCDGLTLTSMLDFGSPGNELVQDMERFACNQWKVILAELIQYPMMFQMVWKFREASREDRDLLVNWTRISDDLQRLMDNADEMTDFDGAVFPDVEGFTVQNADAAIDGFVRAIVLNSTERALRFVLLIGDALVPLFENVLKNNVSLPMNHTSVATLLRSLPDGQFGKERHGRVAWFAFKAAAKTADIVLSDVTNFFHKFKDDNVTLSEIFGPITLTAVFEAFPDYVNTLIHSVLRPDLPQILEEFRYNGSLSFESVCEQPALLGQLVVTPRRLQDVNRTTVLETACRLLSEPFHYFALDPYIYSWAVKTLDKVILLWTEQDPRHIIVHFVDIVDGVEFLANRVADIVGNATDIADYFRRLVSSDRWEIVGNGLYETVVRAQLDSWTHFLWANLSSLDAVPLQNATAMLRTLRITDAVLRVIGRGLEGANDPGHQTSMRQLLGEFPEVQKLVHFVEVYSMDILKVVWYTASIDPLEVNEWLLSPDVWNATCASPTSSFFSVPPKLLGTDGLASLESIKKALCAIDTERLLLEGAEASVGQNGTGSEGDGLARFARTIVYLVQGIANFRWKFPETKLKSVFLDEELWRNTVRQLEPSLEPGSGVQEVFGKILENVVKTGGGNASELVRRLKSLEMLAEATSNNIEFMRMPPNESVWQTFRNWYQNKPQVLTFVDVLEDLPGLATSIVNTFMDPPKLRALLQKLLTLTRGSTLDEFCQDLNLDDYFLILNDTVSFTNVQLLVCATDWSRFAREIYPYPLAVKSRSDSEFRPVDFIAKLGELYLNVVGVMDDGLPYLSANYTSLPWIGERVWQPVITATNQFSARIKDRDRLIDVTIEYVSMVDLIPDWSNVETFFQLLNLQTDVVVKHLEVATDPSLQKKRKMYDVLTDVGLLTEAVGQIHAGVVEAADLSVRYAFLKQLKYFEMFPNDTSHFCTIGPKTVDLSVVEEDLKEWTTLDHVMGVFCKEPPARWIDILQELKIPDENVKSILENVMVVLARESPWVRDPRWQRSIQFNWTTFGDSVHSLDGLCRNPPMDFYPLFSWSAWRPVFKAFGEVLPLMIALSGETVCPTVPWIDYKPFGKLIELVEKQVLLAEEYERLLCDFPRMNLSSIYRRLKTDLDLVETFRQARIQFGRINLEPIHEPDGRSTSCPNMFNATSRLADSLNDLVVDYVENGTRIQKIKDCFKEDTKAVVVEEIDKYIKLVSKVVPLLNLPNVTSLTNSTDLVPLVKDLLNYLQLQVPVFVATRSILRSNHSFALEFSDSPAAMSLVDGSININRLASMHFIAIELSDVFCNSTKLAKFLRPPAGVATESIIGDVSGRLCEDGDPSGKGLSMAERFLEAVDVVRVSSLLPSLRMQTLLSWKLVMSVGRQIQNLGSALLEIKGTVGDLDLEELTRNVTLRRIVEAVVPLIYADNLTSLAHGLDVVTEVLSPIIYGSYFEEDMQKMTVGLHDIYHFMDEHLRNDTISMRELVSDVKTTRDSLAHLGVMRQTVDSVVNLTVNVSVLLFDKKLTQLENLFCQKDIATAVFGLSRDYDTMSSIYNAFCMPDFSIASRVIDRMFENVNFAGILKHEMRLVIKEIAEKAHVGFEDAFRAIQSLLDARQLVPILIKEVKYLQSEGTLLDMLKRLDPEKLAEGEISSSLISVAGNMVCGHPIRSFDEYFRLLQSASERPPEVKDQEELRNLPTPFCQTLYRQIAYRPAGSVIWGFVKPLLKGKILFAPDNDAVRKIVIEANRTFDSLAHGIDTLRKWTKGLALVGEFADHQLTVMEDLLSMPLARSVAIGLMGEEVVSPMLNLSSTLEAMGNPQRFLGAASALGNGLGCFETNRFVGFESEEELEGAAKMYQKQGVFMAGVVFLNLEAHHRIERDATEEDLRNSSGLPLHIMYKIRMDIDAVPTTKRIKARFWRAGPEDNFIEHLRYLRGFVELQDMIDHAIIRTQTGRDADLPGTILQQFPNPCHWNDDFGYLLRSNIPAVTTLAWIFIIAFFVRELVLDREMMLEQVMHVMGLKMWVNWMSWFISCFVVMLVTNVASVLILKYGGVYPRSDLSVLFVFFFIFAISSIMFCFLMSIWFKTATVAAITAVLLYLVFYAPFIVVITLESQLTFVSKILMNLLMSTSFCQGCLYITRFEEQDDGIQWSNIWDSPVPRDEMNFAWACIMMVVDAVLYFVVATYFNAIIRVFKHSDNKLWTFIFWPFLRKHTSHRRKRSQLLSDTDGNLKNGNILVEEFQTKDIESKVGISLQNLRKVYHAGKSCEKVAVEGLTLDFYEGQITTLLGQNGAGKTTTINMLTGQFPPVSGWATIYDRDVVYEFDEIRKNLGICPQYNILFDLLTVREHLEFYGSLKGIMRSNHMADDVDSMLSAMGLVQRQHELAQNLSGGMRRRLCVAIAFVGGSRTIILDEPTSGVDPVARRHIWNLIVRYKQDRTILLTTHNLDEADILSDRVAIIHEGKLLCCGSPLELKRRFGSGYHLAIGKTSGDDGSDTDSGAISTSSGSDSQMICNAANVYTFIRPYIPNVQLVEDHGTEMVFCLPYCNDDGTPNALDGFFLDLEKHQIRLGIGSYGLSCTTLEEVFMNVCLQADAGLPITTQGHKILMLAKRARQLDRGLISKQPSSYDSTADSLPSSVAKVVRSQESHAGTDAWLSKTLYSIHYTHLTGAALKWNQFKWLLLKRFHHFRRDWRGLVTCIVLPCVFVAIAMGFTLIRPPLDPFSPSLLLNPSMYGPDANSFFVVDPGSSPASLRFAEQLVRPPGIGTTCLQDSSSGRTSEHPLCRYLNGRRSPQPESVMLQKEDCTCSAPEEQTCSGRNVTFRFARYLTNSTDVLYNVTEGNVVRWLTLTHVDFIERRFGGWTFGARAQPPSLPGPKENVIAWFESKGYHALPSYINSISNVFLRSSLELDNAINDTSQYGISTYSHPLHLSKMQLGMDSLLHHVADVGIALIFLVSFSFIPAGFIIYLVKERIQEEKRLQYVAGVGPLLYWSAAYFSDMVILCIPICLSAVIIAIFDLPIYMYGHNFAATLTMLFMFGWATTPLMYVAEKFFKEPSLASMILFCVNIFVGINTTLCTLLLFLFQRNEMMGVAMKFLRYFFLLFPQYAFAGGLVDMTKNYIQAEIFIRFGDDTYINPFSMQVLGVNLIVLAIQGVVFFIINLILEYLTDIFIWIEKRRNVFPKDVPVEDGAVQQERSKVLSHKSDGDLMRLANLYKVYSGVAGKTVAVDRVCLSIPQGECFGLLGINGAGKTTIFRMLTGELKPTYGKVFFRNKSIDSAISHGSQNIGYCPQMNALDELLTAEELLSVYAGLRGIPDEDIPLAVYKAVVQFNLQSHARNFTRTYSCGTKRKLCAAISVMGNPDIVLMDEPTSGMDPTTRRLVWDNVQQITKDKRSVILTSHSMEECDTLCQRLAIMVNGRFQCLGSPQYLKHKFGDGYTITLRIHDRPKDWNAIYSYIHDYFPGSVIKAQHCNTVEFLMAKHNSSLGDIFSQLELDKGSLGIKDFSVTQTTLDQVFVNFVRDQSEEGERDMLEEFGGHVNLALVTDEEEGFGIHRSNNDGGRTVQVYEDGFKVEKDYQVTQF